MHRRKHHSHFHRCWSGLRWSKLLQSLLHKDMKSTMRVRPVYLCAMFFTVRLSVSLPPTLEAGVPHGGSISACTGAQVSEPFTQSIKVV